MKVTKLLWVIALFAGMLFSCTDTEGDELDQIVEQQEMMDSGGGNENNPPPPPPGDPDPDNG